MTETQAAQNGHDAAANPRSAYLPVPPAGWEYSVVLRGPAGSISVNPNDPPAGSDPVAPYSVHVDGRTANKSFDVSSLRDGVRAVVDAAKALTAISEHETKAAEAKQKLLDTIGPELVSAPKTAEAAKAKLSRAEPQEDTSTEKR